MFVDHNYNLLGSGLYVILLSDLMHESRVLKQEVHKKTDKFVAPCLGSNSQFITFQLWLSPITFMVVQFITFMGKFYYIYG